MAGDPSSNGDNDMPKKVRVKVTIEMSIREAAWLREMAEFCIRGDMPGSHACRMLTKFLGDEMIPEYDDGPVCGLFERDNHK